jgi:hypothetical protein
MLLEDIRGSEIFDLLLLMLIFSSLTKTASFDRSGALAAFNKANEQSAWTSIPQAIGKELTIVD